MLKKYLNKEKPQKNLKRSNAINVGLYKTNKEIDLEMNKQRRIVLNQIAQLYKQEKVEFEHKYRLF